MASITREKNGRRTIQFVGSDRKRRSVRLGKASQRTAEIVRGHVEALVAAAKVGHAIPPETSEWLNKIDAELHGRLAAVGLVRPRETTTLGTMLTRSIESRRDVKPATLVVWGQVARDLKRHFGDDRDVRTITRGDAVGFHQSLLSRGLALWTIHRRLEFTRMFFKNAVKLELLPASPFEGITQKPGDPGKRRRYVSVADKERLIEAAPNVWWRAIIALSRFAGMRSPSEVLSLRWVGVDWARGTMRIVSPKTDCHDSGGERTAPIFARLRPYLEEAWDAAAEGQTHVIPEGLYLPAANGPRGWNGCNLRTTFAKIICRAGLEVWPRPFHNLRASCESDLVREYPIPTVCKWLGNTVAVAIRHYVDVSDEDVRRAAGLTGQAVQNPVQHSQASPRITTQQETTNPGFAGVCEGVLAAATHLVEDRGLEPLTFWLPARRSPN